MKQIEESDLVQIESVSEFFNVPAVLYLDALNWPYYGKDAEFEYKGKFYLRIVLSGKPQNFILNSPNVINTNRGQAIISFDAKDLPFVINQGKVFDFSKFYRNPEYSVKGKFGYEYKYHISDQFFLNKYVKPYV